MKKTKIEWHKYPEDKPDRDDRYIVSLAIRGVPYSCISYYTKDEGFYDDFIGSVVTAWAELPKPYNKRRTKNTKVKWHPYPQDKPNSLARDYLVTAIYKKKRKVSISIWFKSQNEFDKEDIFSVIAWAEMPEIYEEETNEG